MNSRATLGIVLILVVGISIWLLLSARGMNNGNTIPNDQTQSVSESGVINALHQYKDNKHLIVGQISLPNPCIELTSEAVVRESDPEQVTLLFSTTEHSDFCAQVITAMNFEIKFEASKNAKINALLNNAPVELILNNASEEEITNYKLDIKF